MNEIYLNRFPFAEFLFVVDAVAVDRSVVFFARFQLDRDRVGGGGRQ
jgi:hypothetical protein